MLGWDVAGALPGLRAAAESLMTDSWRCVRGGGTAFDDASGEWTSVPPEAVYDGPGRLRDLVGVGRVEVTQGETTVVGSLRLALPVEGSAGIRVGDVLECVASVMDESLVGTRVKVTDLHWQTLSTARRFSVEVESWPTT